MKTVLLLILFSFSTSASAYCVQYNKYGKCAKQDPYSQNRDNKYQYGNAPKLKPLRVNPPISTKSCQWVLINRQWQSVCR